MDIPLFVYRYESDLSYKKDGSGTVTRLRLSLEPEPELRQYQIELIWLGNVSGEARLHIDKVGYIDDFERRVLKDIAQPVAG